MSAKRILVVDDDAEFLQELEETLRLSGYEVHAVNQSVKAVAAAVQLQPDIILLDLKMDGMSGFEVAKGLRNSPKTARIPIIAISAYFSETQDCTVMDFFQIRRFLQKPFNPLDVIANIESTLKNAEASC